MADRRKVPGTVVEAKAKDVMNIVEATRRYGGLATTKWLTGEVVSVVYVCNPGATKQTCRINVTFDIGNKIVTKEIGIRGIRLPVVVPPPVPVVPPAVVEPVVPVVPPVVEEVVVEVEPINEEATTNNNDDITTAATEDDMDISTETETVATATVATDDTEVNVNNQPDVDFMYGNPVVTKHNQQWFDNQNATLNFINGHIPFRQWTIINGDDQLVSGSNLDKSFTRLDVFKMSFPPNHLNLVLRCTNQQLLKDNKTETNRAELFRLFGVILLVTKFEFQDRGDLWNETPNSKYEVAPRFGRTGMAKNRFEVLIKNLRWSDQPEERGDMSSEHHRWRLVDDFIDAFNLHRAQNFIPSDRICVDESMSRWYGQGGSWINLGLPNYVSIDRKPDSGCEIQTSCCGRSGVMLRLRIVKTTKEEQALERIWNDEEQTDEDELHGTKILKYLVEPWFYRPRLVCADSYFASVASAEALLQFNLRFIGVVKTATRRFPYQFLHEKELTGRGDRFGLVSVDQHTGVPKYLAFVFVDRNRQYFIATAGSMDPGEPCKRTRWRQLVHVDTNLPPEQIRLEIPQPNASAMYYNTCAKIDNHNRDRSDTLRLEKKFGTKDWAKRVNFAIFGMILVDCWKMYSLMTFPYDDKGKLRKPETQKEFYGHLATELIDNNEGRRVTRRSAGGAEEEGGGIAALIVDRDTGLPKSGVAAHLTPTRMKRKLRGQQQKRQKKQGRCRVCPKGVSTMVCSVCREQGTEFFICSTNENAGYRMCFLKHLEECHPIEN
jgi:Transposase IS4